MIPASKGPGAKAPQDWTLRGIKAPQSPCLPIRGESTKEWTVDAECHYAQGWPESSG